MCVLVHDVHWPETVQVSLRISVGQYSDRGHKPINQDSYGLLQPQGQLLHSKGIALAIADGISSSGVGHVASAIAVQSFLGDYFSTPETWSVRESAGRVLDATNAWLYGRTRRQLRNHDLDHGYICTLSAVVICSTNAHVFHVGDSRVYLFRDGVLQQLTDDHRLWISPQRSYLSRAFGTSAQAEIDYHQQSLQQGDILLLTTDGIHDYVNSSFICQTITTHCDDLQQAACYIGQQALDAGSNDNLTIQIVRIDNLPLPSAADVLWQASQLPCPPPLQPAMLFEDYLIIRQLHASHRSHIWLAEDQQNLQRVVIKTPSLDMRQDPSALERLLLEEWITTRISHARLPGAPQRHAQRRFLYTVSEYREGCTLNQWMIDNPQPSLEQVCTIVAQIISALRALHRKSILHLDVRPKNILIDQHGNISLIDFGSAYVAGIGDIAGAQYRQAILGTEQYSAPEYLHGEGASTQSDLFSLGVITYQMLTGQLPYGTAVAAAHNSSVQQKLRYQPASLVNPQLPVWLDAVLQKAVQIAPDKRYPALSEFLYDLQHPQTATDQIRQTTLMQRHPLLFWQTSTIVLLIVCLALLFFQCQ